jgi:TetR/AcrR family transcriptional repressor of bet genes
MPRSVHVPAPDMGTERALRSRQRQKLIDACISALHEYGPSRTTIDKVVSIAGMSPGIVSFYFDTKAALMIAALEFLSTEFEQKVLAPVEALRPAPVLALNTLISLYLDSELASPRKVSVWYSFWGEANSRREYLDICGSQDDRFAALVLDLVTRLIAETRQTHLDAEGVSLGLIGALEILWQGIAFQDEANVDRAAIRARCQGYLNAVFPGYFVAEPAPRAATGADDTIKLPGWACNNEALFAQERDAVFFANWQFLCVASIMPACWDYATIAMLGDRAFGVRDPNGNINAFRNMCARRPHALVNMATGHFPDRMTCDVDGQAYDQQGAGFGSGLTSLPSLCASDLVFVKLGPSILIPERYTNEMLTTVPIWPKPDCIKTEETAVNADWKVVVSQFLRQAHHLIDATEGAIAWRVDAGNDHANQRWLFIYPNLLVAVSSHGIRIIHIVPVSAGQCRLRLIFCGARAASAAIDVSYDVMVAESTQLGLNSPFYTPETAQPEPKAVIRFNQWLRAALPNLR